jgi:hypothetical protein
MQAKIWTCIIFSLGSADRNLQNQHRSDILIFPGPLARTTLQMHEVTVENLRMVR